MPADFDQEVARVLGELHRLEVDTLRQMDRTELDRQGQIRTLGELLIFDKHLSVNQSEASASVTRHLRRLASHRASCAQIFGNRFTERHISLRIPVPACL